MAGMTATTLHVAVPPDLRPHVVTLDNDGVLASNTSPEDFQGVFDAARKAFRAGKPRRIMLYAHGGLVKEGKAFDTTLEHILPRLAVAAEAHLVAFVWRTGFLEVIRHVREDEAREFRFYKTAEGYTSPGAEWVDARVERFVRNVRRIPGLPGFRGTTWWEEMKENAERAWWPGHGGSLVVEELARLRKEFPDLEVHVVAHSAGSILLAPFLQAWTGRGHDVDTVTLWAPAATLAWFHQAYAPHLADDAPRRVRHLGVYTLTEAAELDDHLSVYNKSLLHLVSKGFEGRETPVPLLGMEAHLRHDDAALGLITAWVRAAVDPASGANSHGGFDQDEATLASTALLIRTFRARSTGADVSSAVAPTVP